MGRVVGSHVGSRWWASRATRGDQCCGEGWAAGSHLENPPLTLTLTLTLTLRSTTSPTPNAIPRPNPTLGETLYHGHEDTWELVSLNVQTDSKDSGKLVTATATVKLMDVSSGEEFMEASIGVGPVDATFKVTRTLIPRHPRLGLALAVTLTRTRTLILT